MVKWYLVVAILFSGCGFARMVEYRHMADKFPSLGGIPSAELVSRIVLSNVETCLKKENLKIDRKILTTLFKKGN